MWMLQRAHGRNGCVLASTLCKYDLRKGDLFVLSWTRVLRVMRGKYIFRADNVWCEGDGNAGVGSGAGVVAVSAYMGGTRSSGVFSNACDVLEMSVVRGVCGVCDMCMCLARGGVRGLGLDFTNPGGIGEKWGLCFGCGGVEGVGGSG